MLFDPRKPYNDFAILPPQAEVESRAILKACIEAHAAVAELKWAVLINSIPLFAASSVNIVTTTDRLSQFVDAASYAKLSPVCRRRTLRSHDQ